MEFKQISPMDLQISPFTGFNNQWALLTAEKDGKINTMTVSWGGLGILWNKPVATAYIRPQRFTKEFIDGTDSFSLSFFNEDYREKLVYCGRTSGRDEDKIKKCGFTVAHKDETPYFEEAQKVLIIKKLFAQEMTADSILDSTIAEANYQQKDYHTIYIGEILSALEK